MERDLTRRVPLSTNLISTHTLTWSVTLRSEPHTLGIVNFNSHAHVERDGLTYGGALCRTNFNSHAHVERDMLQKILI